ncbi:MAG: ferrichrome-iron receptor [Lacunisphaera sp.]|nr:ferrichrome-iron receptor [Lacunisphaera sp.]
MNPTRQPHRQAWFASAALPLTLALALPFVPLRAQEKTGDESTTPVGETIKLETFQVKTELGRYHDSMSATGTKIPMEMKEISASLQVFNANALADRNAVTLQDVYTYIIGMNQVQPNANGFTFRGFSAAGTFTQNINFDGLMGTTSSKGALNTENVERVEFLKGPNSVLYGQMKPGGMLNIVTKVPQAKRATTIRTSFITYWGRYNSFGEKQGYVASFDTTGPIDEAKHWLYRLIVAGSDLSPFRNLAYEHSYYFYPSLTYKWSDDTYLTVKAELLNEKRHADDNLTPLSFNPNLIAQYNVSYQEPSDYALDKGEAFSTFFTTKWDHNWTLRFNSRLTWHDDFLQQLGSRTTNPTLKSPIENSLINRRLVVTDNGHRYDFADLSVYGKIGPQNFEHTPIVGIYGGNEFFDNHRLANGPAAGTVNLFNPILGVTPYPAFGTGALDQKQPLSAFSWYVSDQMRILNRWHVSLGTRYEQQISSLTDTINPTVQPRVDQFVSKQTSQAGVVFDVTSSLSAYASWSQSFVPSDVSVLDQNGNSGFPSETGEQYETGLKFETPNKNFYASLAAYQIKRQNVAVGSGLQLPDGRAYFRIDGEQESKGLEFETQWLPRPYWQFQAGFAFNHASITKSVVNPISVGKDLANAPRFTGNLWTRYNFPTGKLKGFGMGLGIIRVGDQYAGSPSATNGGYYKVAGWTRVDTAYYYKWHRYEFALDIKNIFDRKYILAAFNATTLIPGEPRKFTFSATRRF